MLLLKLLIWSYLSVKLSQIIQMHHYSLDATCLIQ